MKLKERLKHAVDATIKFVSIDIWSLDIKSTSKAKKWFIKTMRTFTLALRGFKEDKVDLRASALTFYSLLSIVPIMAMAFGIAKGFGFDEKLKELLQENAQGQEVAINWLINFATNMLDSVKGGVMFGVGLVFLIWSVMKVLGNIESSFNSIWQVKKSRVLFRKFSDYFSIMLIAPILILMSSSAQVIIIETVDKLTHEYSVIDYVSPAIKTTVRLVPYLLIWLLFTFIYLVMPNTKVKLTSALVAGIIAGTAFQLLQWGYFHFQFGVSRYNAIYGSFAALPLFLVWLNWSWLIVLFGAEISYSAQNQRLFEFETDIKKLSLSNQHLLSLLIMNEILKNFMQGKAPFTTPELSDKFKIPFRLVRQLIYQLIDCNILAETPSPQAKEPAFIPSRNPEELTAHFVLEQLHNNGTRFSSIDNNKTLIQLEKTIKEFREMINKTDQKKLYEY